MEVDAHLLSFLEYRVMAELLKEVCDTVLCCKDVTYACFVLNGFDEVLDWVAEAKVLNAVPSCNKQVLVSARSIVAWPVVLGASRYGFSRQVN